MQTKLTKICLTEDEMLSFGKAIADALSEGTVIFLEGQLGAGKTTLTRGILRGFGYNEKVKSPTYTLVEPYELPTKTIFHFDFYRIKHADELELIGIKEYFFADAICIVEWPEKGFPLLPEPDLICRIENADTGRKLTLEAHSKKGENVLSLLN